MEWTRGNQAKILLERLKKNSEEVEDTNSFCGACQPDWIAKGRERGQRDIQSKGLPLNLVINEYCMWILFHPPPPLPFGMIWLTAWLTDDPRYGFQVITSNTDRRKEAWLRHTVVRSSWSSISVRFFLLKKSSLFALIILLFCVWIDALLVLYTPNEIFIQFLLKYPK